MDQGKISGATILAAGSASGHRFELRHCEDGSFVIVRDGTPEAVYESGACNLEACIKSFLGFIRSESEAGL